MEFIVSSMSVYLKYLCNVSKNVKNSNLTSMKADRPSRPRLPTARPSARDTHKGKFYSKPRQI